jgi:hypothetical protein
MPLAENNRLWPAWMKLMGAAEERMKWKVRWDEAAANVCLNYAVGLLFHTLLEILLQFLSVLFPEQTYECRGVLIVNLPTIARIFARRTAGTRNIKTTVTVMPSTIEVRSHSAFKRPWTHLGSRNWALQTD